uniref:Uncharacterized protein n=1 Tax=Chromera velia CCMP2878 TaxID=1169474 RepID=A0A0G4HVW5_9ALVE|eukprot:Cvel_8901.t1-p1 / transcript=Cvel_8901.t1 / gene=Cvel_8901 / organism=Chromera_velia_CCMP2878 / gene_product=Protein phosphatase 1 regulatory subunit 37, putative / transcript_product=Protein phosphatase 1 regulatory subunit 37, putative / location=Cvel_scaffold501:31582-36667(-) / protein_length=980 / sequence_SO=supercontig / SO=protein_coding / is_pseudo=false
MSQSDGRDPGPPLVGGGHEGIGILFGQRIESALSAVFGHARPTSEAISELASNREGFGLAWLLLQFINTGDCLLPLDSLDLSGFSLGSGKLDLLLSSLPSRPGVVESLACGPHVCKSACRSVLFGFLLRRSASLMEGSPSARLKSLNLSKCELYDTGGGIIQLFPPSLEHLDLSGNWLRNTSMTILSDALVLDRLPILLSLNLSDNPLGLSGIRELARGLSSRTRTLPLQSLKLARTRIRAEGVGALMEALKAKKTIALHTLDLAENEMSTEGVRHLSSAVSAGAVPNLRILILNHNFLTQPNPHRRDYAPLAEFLSTRALTELEVLDLGANFSFNGQGTTAATAVAQSFPNLRRLDMGEHMSSIELSAFASALGSDSERARPRPLEDLVVPVGGTITNAPNPENPVHVVPDPEGINGLASAVGAGHVSHLKSLKICWRWDLVRGAEFGVLTRSLVSGKVSDLRSLELEMAPTPNRPNISEGVWALADGIQGRKLPLLENLRLVMDRYLTDSVAMAALGRALGGGGCAGLQKVHLKWEEEGDEGAGGLAEGLGSEGLPSLRDLSFSFNCREGGADGCIALGQVLSVRKLPSLRRVGMECFPSETFCFLCEGLSRGEGLAPPVVVEIPPDDRSLGHFFDVQSLMKFAQTLRTGKLSGLRKLEVCCSFIMLSNPRHAALTAVGEALTSAESSLKWLEKLKIGEGDDYVAAILEGMSRGNAGLPSLRALQCNQAVCVEVPPDGPRSLAEVMRKTPCLRDLDVHFLYTMREGMQAFAATLSSPSVSALRRLTITFCVFDEADLVPELRNGPHQVAMISEAINSGHLRRLEELCVKTLARIEDFHTFCMALGSRKMPSLRRFRIIHTSSASWTDERWKVEGGRILSGVFMAERLPSLRTLEMRDAGLGDEGLKALTDAWMNRTPPPLQEVNLSCNALTGAVTPVLLPLLGSKCIPTLERIVLGGNSIDERSKRLLAQSYPDIFEF